MDWTASAIKPGRRSLNRTSMDGRRARGAIKDPSHALCDDVTVVPHHSHAGWCLHQCWLLAAGLRWCLCIANGLIVMLVTKRGPDQLAFRAQLHPQDQFCVR